MIEKIDQNPAPDSYAPAKEVTLEWRNPPSSDFAIELRERSYRFAEKTFPKDGSGYFDLVLEVENTGRRTIRGLKLAAEIVGPDGQWELSDENHVALLRGPALQPGEVWLERFFTKVEGQPEGYRMFVVDVQ